jgi:hypothetical protein
VVAFVGSLVHQASPRAPLLISLGLTAATIGVVSSLPDAPNPPRAAAPPMGPIVRRSLPFLIVSTLHGMALVGFDAWWPFHVERIGLPGWVAGAGVAAAVFVEVTIMFAGRSLFARVRPETLVLCAIAAGIPQWALTAWVADPWVLIAAQGLRGAAFGAFWIAGVELLAGRSPPETRASAQSLLPATSYGFGFLLQVGLSGAVLAFGTTRALCATFAVVEIVALAAFLLLSRVAPSPQPAPAGSPVGPP